MKKHRASFFLVILFSFTIGIWWSLHQAELLRSQAKLAPQKLRILSFPGMIPLTVIKQFEEFENVSVTLVETKISNFFEGIDLKAKEYDVFALTSFYTHELNKFIKLEQYNPVEIANSLNILPDFLEMGLVSSKFFVPISWGINGLASKSDGKNDLLDLNFFNLVTKHPKEIAILADSDEIYSSLNRVQSELRNWVEQNKLANLEESLKEYFGNVQFVSDFQPSEKGFSELDKIRNIQTTNGEWAFSNRSKERHFVIPNDGATLWVDVLAVNGASNKKNMVHKFVDFLLSPEVNTQLVRVLKKASPINLPDMELPPLAKADFLKTIPLSKIDFPRRNLGQSEAWRGTLQSVFPKQFKNAIEVQ